MPPDLLHKEVHRDCCGMANAELDEVAELHAYVADGVRVHNYSVFAMELGFSAVSFVAEQLIAGRGFHCKEGAALGGARLECG